MCLVLSRTCLLNRSAFCNQNCNVSEVFVIHWKSLRVTTPMALWTRKVLCGSFLCAIHKFSFIHSTPSLRPCLFRKPFPSYFSPWYNHTGWLGVKYQLTYLPSYFCYFRNLSRRISFISETFPVVFVYFRSLFLRLSLFQKHFPSYFFVYLRKRSLCISFYLFQKPFTLYFFASEPLPMDHLSLKGTLLRRINFSCALSS